MSETACTYCGASDGLVIDHIHPRSRGGSNRAENKQWLCGRCNGRKGARTEEEFLARLCESRIAKLMRPTFERMVFDEVARLVEQCGGVSAAIQTITFEDDATSCPMATIGKVTK